MLEPRYMCGSCVINNCLYVAGGGLVQNGIIYGFESAEIYDPLKNRWFFVADMTRRMLVEDGYVYNGMWFLTGVYGSEQNINEAYNPETNKWIQIGNGLVASRRNPTIVIDGNLYIVSCKDGCKLDLCDASTNMWVSNYIVCSEKFHLSRELPELMTFFDARKLSSLNKGKLLCIVRDNMTILVVDMYQDMNMMMQEEGSLKHIIFGRKRKLIAFCGSNSGVMILIFYQEPQTIIFFIPRFFEHKKEVQKKFY
ncbi:F-box/kelch-repeat protein At1g55270-like [Papaver somniferum]|nr:F-box/kelch-repeat protein At1g55270-like [Papaver somniferum]